MSKPREIILTSAAHGGDALGRHQGKVVFVPGGIPGERVRVEVTQDHPRYARARLLEVLEPSPDRLQPRCAHWLPGGSCGWEHITYARQLELKTRILRDQLVHIGRLEDPPLEPMLGMEDPWRYRNHAQLHFDPQGRAGYLEPGGGRIVPVETCSLLDARLEEMLGWVQAEESYLERLILRVGVHTGERLVGLVGSSPQPPAVELDEPANLVWIAPDGHVLCLAGQPYLHERLLDRTFRVSATSFFQVNTLMAERTVEAVLEAAALRGHETVLDAYSGVGTFACFLARQAAHVVAMESHPLAAQDALANAEDLDNVEIHHGSVEELLPEAEGELDLALLDPPRGGVAGEVLEALARIGPPRVLYVSCDPATLARDVKRLGRDGYRLSRCQPIDLFPHTPHIESLSVFNR